MNRRTFLRLLGMVTVATIPAINALTGSGSTKRAKPTRDIGYAEDRVTGERMRLYGYAKAWDGKKVGPIEYDYMTETKAKRRFHNSNYFYWLV